MGDRRWFIYGAVSDTVTYKKKIIRTKICFNDNNNDAKCTFIAVKKSLEFGILLILDFDNTNTKSSTEKQRQISCEKILT